MEETELKNLIVNDEDYVNIGRFKFSLKKLCHRFPDGAPDRIIAQALCISEADVPVLWQEIVLKLRSKIKPKDQNDQ